MHLAFGAIIDNKSRQVNFADGAKRTGRRTPTDSRADRKL